VTPTRAQEITWKVAEMSFRYECLALDLEGCGRNREAEVLKFFPGPPLNPKLEESKLGFAAADPQSRLPSILGLASLMRDWRFDCRSQLINRASELAEGHWDRDTIGELEDSVASYYTQSFFEVYGRAPVVPLRL
ncbi:hypothetical protein GGX14DRAFT_314827, partial [Mycena pura]